MPSVPSASEDFARLADPYRHELLAHCYRMLGSVHDAEDQVQETLIRAWRSYADFEGRSSMRTWLYRIATNTCLRALETRARRPLPSGLGSPEQDPVAALTASGRDVPWLQPMPDWPARHEQADPAAVITTRASLRLGLIAALQYLPPRQRAVLILRDVLGWRAAEVAELLGMSVTAANSTLQRARAQLEHHAPAEDDMREPSDPPTRALLARYAAAFEAADVAALTQLLHDEAIFEMPPQPAWFSGREMIGRFLAEHVLCMPGRFRLTPVTANSQPGFASYERAANGSYQAHGIMVVGLRAGLIGHVVSFNDASLLAMFGLPGSDPGRPGRVPAAEAR